jgi:hypothetical protein
MENIFLYVDNLYLQLANTLKDFDTVAQRSPKWNWPEHELSSSAKFYPRSKFKSGDVIWATKDNITITPFGKYLYQY